MYLGRVAELADRRDAVPRAGAPVHPGAHVGDPGPRPDAPPHSGSSSRATCPSPVNPPTGCRFHPRCPLREQLGQPGDLRRGDPAAHRHRRRPPVRLPLPPAGGGSGSRPGTSAAAAGRRRPDAAPEPGRRLEPLSSFTLRGESIAAGSSVDRPSVVSTSVPSSGHRRRTRAPRRPRSAPRSGPRSARFERRDGRRRRPAPDQHLAEVGDPDVGLERLVREVAGGPVIGTPRPPTRERRIDRPALLGLAESLVQPAAGVEAAARRRVDRARARRP